MSNDAIASTSLDPAGRKAGLRTRLRARRRELVRDEPHREREAQALRRVAEPLIRRVREQAASTGTATVSAFWPTPTEPDVRVVVAAMREAVEADGHRLRVLFPAASGGPEMQWVDGDERAEPAASPGRGFGDEPAGERIGTDGLSRADLVLAPALGVDRSGTRIGHGGGYYDRALPHRRPGVPVIAVVHPHELLGAGEIDRTDHDVPVDGVLTTGGLTDLGGGMLDGGMLPQGD